MVYILGFILKAVAIIIVTTVFEFSKGIASYMQGDMMAKQQRKLSLNPFKHFEPIGFILFLFIGYGWTNPIPTSSLHYKDRKKGTIITYLTPIILSVVLANVFNLIYQTFSYLIIFNYLSQFFARIAVFNIIPVYPLAGSWILKALLNPNSAMKYSFYEKQVQWALIFFLFLGLLNPILNEIVNFVIWWFYESWAWS